jgi:hypothetical protein
VGDLGSRVESKILGRHRVAELKAIIDAPIRHPKFLEHEENFLHVAGSLSAQELDHETLLL